MRLSTDDAAFSHRYRWLGPQSIPLPAASFGAWGLFLALWAAITTLAAALAPLAALMASPALAFLAYALTRAIRSVVTKERPMAHHTATILREIHTPRPERGSFCTWEPLPGATRQQAPRAESTRPAPADTSAWYVRAAVTGLNGRSRRR